MYTSRQNGYQVLILCPEFYDPTAYLTFLANSNSFQNDYPFWPCIVAAFQISMLITIYKSNTDSGKLFVFMLFLVKFSSVLFFSISKENLGNRAVCTMC